MLSFHLGWAIKAHVTRVDTHVYWTADRLLRWDDLAPGPLKKQKQTLPFFKHDYSCDVLTFNELRRELVLEVSTTDPEDLVYLNEYQEKHADSPKSIDPYVYVHKVENNEVKFDVNFWGYKYELKDLTLTNEEFQLFTKRLNPSVVLAEYWDSLGPLFEKFHIALKNVNMSASLKTRLEKELTSVRMTSNYESACRSFSALLETYIRELKSTNNWKGSDGDLGSLIGVLKANGNPPQSLMSLLQIVGKPTRDHFNHGNTLPDEAAKVVAMSCLSIFLMMFETYG
ncbi:hypothetical protein [Bdellovibrio sp. HCB337]|uniref:hypothetical protein n=1 Tax=Bdellovibrio sp. HCB337 TaxID=3394358 RepID=UPI0039A443D5